MKSIELRRKRAKLIEDAGAILTAAHNETRDITADEQQTFDRLHTDAARLLTDIERLERQAEAERQLAESADLRQLQDAPQDHRGRQGQEVTPEEERRAFRSFCRHGYPGMSEEDRQIAARGAENVRRAAAEDPEIRALTVTTTGGGYTIPAGFQAELDATMVAFGGMLDAARVLTTSTGNPLPWPTMDDTSNTGELLGINTQVNEQDVAFGVKNFGAYKYSSKAVRVPVELLQDTAFDIDGLLSDAFGQRLGRITNTHLTTGDGSSKPTGILAASGGAADSAINVDISSGLTYDNMVDIEHTVDPAYRMSPKCGWMFHDDFLALVKKVVDLNGRPIFRPASEVPGGVDRILGYPVWINQQVPDPGTATNKAVLFGDFSKYIVRRVRPMVMVRVVERYADYHQIGFFAFERLDGNLLQTSAVKFADMVA